MSRAAILPFPGDPFLLNYWLSLYERTWADRVDTLYVYMNSPIADEVVEYCLDRCNRAGAHFHYIDHQVEHGEVLKLAVHNALEDEIMFVEDDGYIWHPGPVAYAFGALESGQFDIVGSKRGSCGHQIMVLAGEKWGIPYEGEGDQGPNFWPCFFFSHRELLLKIDNFAARQWQPGELIRPLGVLSDYLQNGDTMVEASLELRDMVPPSRILTLPQYHVHPLDIDHAEKHQSIWDGQAGWLHVGSLSTGISGLLCDQYSRPLAKMHSMAKGPATDLQPKPTNEFERQEYERRAQWWLKFYEKREPGKLPEFAETYRQAIEQLIYQFGLNRKRIQKRWRLYSEVYGF